MGPPVPIPSGKTPEPVRDRWSHLLPRCALALALCVLGGCGPAEMEAYSGTITFPDAQVGSLVGGRVLEIRKQEGERVLAGEVLVVLDPKEWQGALDEAEALAEATAREVDLLVAGPRPEDIARARAEARRLELMWEIVAKGAREEEIAAAHEDLRASDALFAEAQAEAVRERELVGTGSSTAERLEQVLARRDEARARKGATEQRLHLLERGARPEEVEAARQAWLAGQAQVQILEAGSRPEEIAARKATLEAAGARARVARSKLEELTIAAPGEAFVQTLDLRAGDLIQPGQPVAVLLLLENPWITIYVPERDLASVNVGQKATVHPDGHPPLDAAVTWVSREAEYTPRNVQTRDERTTQVFAVKLTLSGDTSRLKDGMWADVEMK